MFNFEMSDIYKIQCQNYNSKFIDTSPQVASSGGGQSISLYIRLNLLLNLKMITYRQDNGLYLHRLRLFYHSFRFHINTFGGAVMPILKNSTID